MELLNIRIVKKSCRKDQNDSCLTKKAEQIYYYGEKDLWLFSAGLASVGGGNERFKRSVKLSVAAC